MKKALFSLVGAALLALVIFIVVLSPAFRLVKSVSDIYGVYFADYSVASEKLVLNQDGTFDQELTLKSTGAHDTASGRWQFNPKSSYVTFDSHILVPIDGTKKFNPDYKLPKNGSGASYPVERYFGNIYLGSSEGVLYHKN